ncbi:hypothetical protein D3C71_1471510 [compost metagenome]
MPVGAHVAPVEQDVAVRAQARADRLPGAGRARQAGDVEGLVAQRDLARAAVAEDVQRREAAAPFERLAQLFDAGRAGVQQDQAGALRHRSRELLPIGNVLVDDVDLAGRGRGRAGPGSRIRFGRAFAPVRHGNGRRRVGGMRRIPVRALRRVRRCRRGGLHKSGAIK